MTAAQRVLFDINHPAQVHLFKHAIAELERRGHETAVTSRDKEITVELLDAHDIEHSVLSTARSGTVSLVRELLVRERKLFGIAREFDPDMIVSRLSPAAAHVSQLVGCPNLVFTDTVVPSKVMQLLNYGVTLPFVDIVCTPPDFDLPIPVSEHHEVGFHELAYLHPNWFTPDTERLAAEGVAVDEPYFVLRFAAWDAYHDVGNAGWSREGQREIVEFLADRGTVYITSERDIPPEFEEYELSIPPELIHDLLSAATLYVGDSQTMGTEAAILGTPAIRVNSKVDNHEMSNFTELERRELLFSYSDETAALEKAGDLLAGNTTGPDWEAKRQSLLDAQSDVTAVMLDLILDGNLSRDGAEPSIAGPNAPVAEK